MTLLVSRTENALTPQLITEMRQNLPTDGAAEVAKERAMTETLRPSPEERDDDTYAVRPYAVTGGRVSRRERGPPHGGARRSCLRHTETLRGLTPEKKKILQLAAGQYQSVAELSAHTRLPLGVVRVLVTDLAEEKYLRIHTSGTARRCKRCMMSPAAFP